MSVKEPQENDLEVEELGDVREHLEAKVENLFFAAEIFQLGEHAVGGVESHLTGLCPQSHLKPVKIKCAFHCRKIVNIT